MFLWIEDSGDAVHILGVKDELKNLNISDEPEIYIIGYDRTLNMIDIGKLCRKVIDETNIHRKVTIYDVIYVPLLI